MLAQGATIRNVLKTLIRLNCADGLVISHLRLTSSELFPFGPKIQKELPSKGTLNWVWVNKKLLPFRGSGGMRPPQMAFSGPELKAIKVTLLFTDC